jgi:hypothetical protein
VSADLPCHRMGETLSEVVTPAGAAEVYRDGGVRHRDIFEIVRTDLDGPMASCGARDVANVSLPLDATARDR